MVIGQEIDHAAAAAALDACLLTEEEMEGGEEAWAKLPDPLTGVAAQATAAAAAAVAAAQAAIAAEAEGRLSEAAEGFEKALTMREAEIGSDHPSLADSVFALANVRKAQGRLDDAAAG